MYTITYTDIGTQALEGARLFLKVLAYLKNTQLSVPDQLLTDIQTLLSVAESENMKNTEYFALKRQFLSYI